MDLDVSIITTTLILSQVLIAMYSSQIATTPALLVYLSLLFRCTSLI